MTRSAIAMILLATGCTSAAEAAYREQIECLSQYPEGAVPSPPGCCAGCCEMPGRTAEVIAAERDRFRARAIELGRALGKSPAEVAADARAYHAEIVGPDAHGSEERMEALGARCDASFAG